MKDNNLWSKLSLRSLRLDLYIKNNLNENLKRCELVNEDLLNINVKNDNRIKFLLE